MTLRRNMNGHSRGFPLLGVFVALFFLVVLAFFTANYARLEGDAPLVAFDRDFDSLGPASSLELRVEDAATGLREIVVRLNQNDQEVVLVRESFEGPGALSFGGTGAEKSRSYDVARLIAENYEIREGSASLSVTVADYSIRDVFGGNRTEVVADFDFDLRPPRLEVLSDQHYINQGGSECVVYRVSEDAAISGIRVGPHFFPGVPIDPDDETVRFALFAYAYDLPPDTPVQLVARDGAGNESVATPWQRVFPGTFRTRNIVLDDSFLEKVVSEIAARTPGVEDQGELIETYVDINSRLRRQNHETIKDLSKGLADEFLWDGAFLQLSNSQVESFFADRRTYLYEGEPVDQQDHVGFDLSVTARYPIEAANAGRVIYADYFGIYGNTVLIDHGVGLLSLYAHMSSIDVEPGQMVAKRETLGRSGATGLAGGDHLHFGLFLHGVPVNPIEWWDAKWIQEHVLDRLATDATGPTDPS